MAFSIVITICYYHDKSKISLKLAYYFFEVIGVIGTLVLIRALYSHANGLATRVIFQVFIQEILVLNNSMIHLDAFLFSQKPVDPDIPGTVTAGHIRVFRRSLL